MQCGVGTPDEIRVGRIFDRIRKDAASVLFERVRTHHNQKWGSKGKSVGFNDFLTRSAINGSNMLKFEEAQKLTDEELYELVKSYYNKWADIAGSDWDEIEIYMTGDKMGLKVLTSCICHTFKLILDANKPLSVKSLEEFIDSRISTDRKKSLFKRLWAKSVRGDKWGYTTEQGVYKQFCLFLGKGKS